MPGIPIIKGLFKNPVLFAAVLDQVPMGILVLDTHRRILILNQAAEALTGFSRKDACGLACYSILRSRICFKGCPVLSLGKDSERISLESDIINRDRQMIPIRVTIAPIVATDGEIAGYLETVEDMRLVRELDAKRVRAFRFSQIIGKSPQMEKIFAMLPLLAQNDSSVLITGETGTGKDLVAEAIHEASNRAKGPFIKINCGALPETLLESELFGHRKGAFTGAVENKPGRFRLAHNGTLFLTEVGDLPLLLQVKLLSFLDDKVVYPLGSGKGFPVDVRVIAGTHRNLEQMVREGRFRKDLLFRLNVVRVQLPSLRERGEDIRLLIDHFLARFSSRFGKKIKGLSKSALALLTTYDYPGNVRELRNIIEYAVNICQKQTLGLDHLPAYLSEPNPEKAEDDGFLKPAVSPPAESIRPVPEGYAGTWAETERQLVLDALVKAGGRRSKAAENLGWARSTLWRKMKQHDLF
jgi:two-component system, NtrC family, response regulator AtoC